jgi:hypothetical protein
LSATGKVVLTVGTVVVGALLAVAVVGGLAAHKAKVAGLVTTTTAAEAGSTGHATSTTSTTTKAEATAQLLSDVTMTPMDGSVHQSLKTVVSVRVAGARLERVEVEAPYAGVALAGHLDAARNQWRSTGALLPGATYRVSYEVVGGDGLAASGTGCSPPLTLLEW